jgi:hypothetical protein
MGLNDLDFGSRDRWTRRIGFGGPSGSSLPLLITSKVQYINGYWFMPGSSTRTIHRMDEAL